MESIGTYLRREREVRGIALEEVADTTRIPVRTLRSIETDRFDELPGDVFIRGFLKAYARAVGLVSDEVLARYSSQVRAHSVAPAPPRLPTVVDRGRRFGLAIALVVFTILATLAVSFLLRPRTQERPEQLSRTSPPALSAPLALRT